MGLPSGDADICTLAMDYIKAEEVNNLTPASTEIEALCSRWLPISRQAVLCAFPYTFSKTRGSILRNATAPKVGYTDAYDLPNDFLLLTFLYEEHIPLTQWDYVIEGRQILLNNGGANSLALGYVRDIEDVTQFPPLIRKLVALELADNVCFAITGKASISKNIAEKKAAAKVEARTINGFNQPSRVYRASKIFGNSRRYTSNQTFNSMGRLY